MTEPRKDVTVAALDRVEQRPAEVERTDLDRAVGRVQDMLGAQIAFIRSLLDERDRRYMERAELTDRALAAALAAAKEAVAKAENASEKRFDGVNEFRLTLSDQQRTLLPRSEAEHRMGSTEAKVLELEKNLLAITASQRGSKDMWGYVVGGVGIILALASFAITNFTRR